MTPLPATNATARLARGAGQARGERRDAGHRHRPTGEHAIVSGADLHDVSRRPTGTLTPMSLDARGIRGQNPSREALAQPGRAPAF